MLFSCNNKPAIESINEKDLQMHLEFIASDLLKGREAGSHETELTAAYIITQLKNLNISPYHPDSSYLQSVDTVSIMGGKYEGENLIRVINNQTEIFINDIMLMMFPPEISFTPEDTLIYGGYGLDFQDKTNLTNKTVIILSGKPDEANTPETFDCDFEFAKLQNIYQKGANSVIWAFNPNETKTGFRRFMSMVRYPDDSILSDKKNPEKISGNTVFITKNSAVSILNLSNKTTDNKILVLENTKIGININRKKTDVNLKNVIGFIKGSDPVLQNEFIIYTAHYDHLGMIANEVYNGADDNGSGTVALLEIAEAYSLSSERPKRSIVFIWMDGEETGLNGSKYYTNHPVFPLEKTKLCINLDMIGRVKCLSDTGFVHGRNVDVQEADSLNIELGNIKDDLLKIQIECCKNSGIFGKYTLCKSKANSDHYPFYEKGIPVVFYSTGLHPQYHMINDETERINYVKIKQVAKLAFSFGYEIANQ